MRVEFFGVRGSTPAPGPAFARYGGHTSCVGISPGDGAEGPLFVCDGGTGLRALSEALGGGPFVGTIALSHLHWDHIQGLPFFAAADHPESRTRVLVPVDLGVDATAALRPMLGPPFFPLQPHELRGQWSFEPLAAGEQDLDGLTLSALPIPHLGATFGFRVTDGVSSVAYLSDHATGLSADDSNARALVTEADLLIHDAQHTAAEFPAKAFLGHSTAEYAVELATAAGCKRVALFHHDFERTDDGIDAIAASLGGGPVEVIAARQGLVIDL